MPAPWLGWISVAASTLLVSCGGSSSDQSEQIGLSVTTDLVSCSGPTVHDSGKLLYVVLPRECEAKSGTTVILKLRFASAETTVIQMQQGQEVGQVSIAELGVRKVGLFQSGQWRKFNNKGSWAARDGAGLLELNGELFLLGGWLNGPVSSEVWKTDDLNRWTFLGEAPWPARHGAAWLAHKNQLWVIGGDLYTDVWTSKDGILWTQQSADAPFGRRYTPNAAVIGEDIFVYAGQDWSPVQWCNSRSDCQAHADRSVWKSKDGKSWGKVIDAAPWPGRGLIHGSVVFQDQIFLIGGGLKVPPPNERYSETVAEYTDIWSSSDGMTWILRTPMFSFAGRTHFSVLGTERGCFVSDGSVGRQNNLSNDLFYAPDCINFKPMPVPSDFGRRHASSVASFNGSVVILGGPDYGTAGTAVWQYFP